MIKINKIFQNHFPHYTQKRRGSISKSQFKMANALSKCRTGEYGYTSIACHSCKHAEIVKNGCGNRHCPQCQQHKNIELAKKQKEKLLPGIDYFMVTFTIPEGMRSFFFSHQKFCYDSLFQVSSEAIKGYLNNNEFLGAFHTGFFGVLHTWDSQMNYHPHIHFIVPAVGLSEDKKKIKINDSGFLFPEKEVSKTIRAKFYDLTKTSKYAREYLSLPFKDRMEGWNVHCREPGNGKNAIHYLSRYVFKSVIAESRIKSVEEDKVTFTYKRKDRNKNKTAIIDIHEFIRRFLLHSLPEGFKKVRYYGFLHGRSSKNYLIIQLLLKTKVEVLYQILEDNPELPISKIHCPKCKSTKIAYFRTYNKKGSLMKSG